MSIVILFDQECTPEELEAAVDLEIATWDKEFQAATRGDPLAPSEKAIIKTYLGMRLLPKLKKEGEAPPMPDLG